MKKLIFSLLLLVSLLFAKIETYTRDYTYYAGDEDSKNSSRAAALVQVKKLLLEEVGTYIESHSLVENNMLTKDEIIAVSAGVIGTKILSEDWNGKTYVIKAEMQLDPEDVQKKLNIIAQDQSKTNELKEQYAKVQKALADNEKLTKELAAVKDELHREKLNKQYQENTNTLSASEWYYKGYEAYFKRDYNTAIECYMKSIELDSKFAEAYSSIGASYFGKGDSDAAIKFCLKAIEVNPKLEIAYCNLGLLWQIKGNNDLAVSYLQKAIEINPQFAIAYNHMGLVFQSKGEYDTAIMNYQKAIEINPKLELAYCNIGFSYSMKGEYDLAIKNLNKSLELKPNPDYYLTFMYLGFTYGLKKDYDLLLKFYQKAIDLRPEVGLNYFFMGIGYANKGDAESAYRYYKKSAQLGCVEDQNVLKGQNIRW